MGRKRDSDDRHAPRVLIAVPTRDMTAAAISGRLALLLVDLARRPESPAIEIVPGILWTACAISSAHASSRATRTIC